MHGVRRRTNKKWHVGPQGIAGTKQGIVGKKQGIAGKKQGIAGKWQCIMETRQGVAFRAHGIADINKELCPIPACSNDIRFCNRNAITAGYITAIMPVMPAPPCGPTLLPYVN